MTGTMRDLWICQDCHTPARFLHQVCVAFCHAPRSNAHMWIHGLAQKIYRKRCCRRPHAPRGPSWSGRPRSSERKISQIGVSAHIAQSAMFRALRDFPHNGGEIVRIFSSLRYYEKNYVLQYMRGKSPLCEETGAFSEFTCLLIGLNITPLHHTEDAYFYNVLFFCVSSSCPSSYSPRSPSLSTQ